MNIKILNFLKEYGKNIILLVVIWVMFLILNVYTTLMADDYSYVFSFETGRRLNGIFEILKDVKYMFFNWSGRITSEILVKFFVYIGKIYFDIINSSIFILLIYLISKHIVGQKKVRIFNVIYSIFIVWFLTPVFGQVNLWIAGSITYLWSITFGLLFLLPYRLSLDKKIKIKRIFKIVLYIIGFFIGMTPQTITGCIFILCSIFIFIYLKKYKKIEKWMLIGIIILGIGIFISIIAPGNYVRLAQMAQEKNELLILNNIKRGYKNILPVIILQFVFYFLLKRKKIIINKMNYIYLFVVLVMIFLTIFLPPFSRRAYYGINILSYISLGIIFFQIDLNRKKYINFFLFILYFISFLYQFNKIAKLYSNRIKREKTIIEEQKKGIKNLKIEIIKSNTKYDAGYRLEDLRDKEYWTNQSIAKYYNLDSIEGIKNE